LIEFLQEMDISILSERRVFKPYGMHGGQDGQVGKNTLLRKTANGYVCQNLGGKNSTKVFSGDAIRIETPGGGGWGHGLAQGIQKQATKTVKRAGGSLENFMQIQNSV
jgi:5-oxoprolinase (ATP-hydrolysing)